MTVLLGEILHVHDMAQIATILITEDKLHYISSKADVPTNFTKLSQYIMISKGSWVFNKKEKGSNNVYARFRLKSQVNTEEIVNRVSFKFSCLGGKNLQKKQHQAMETETPLMLLFCAMVRIRRALSPTQSRCLTLHWTISNRMGCYQKNSRTGMSLTSPSA